MLAIGLPLVSVNAFILVLFGGNVLSLFTKDQEILTICASLLWMNLLLQPGKMINMALGNSLNAIGDTRYTMVVSLIVMWLVATGCSYLLGVHLGWGIIAIYACMIMDEYIRGILSFLRWRGRKYMRMKETELGQEDTIFTESLPSPSM
ncbi:MATE family multidrug exporter [compost metagenome]